MVSDYITSKKEKGHTTLVWETLSLIMKKASVEFKGGMKKIVDHGTWSETMVMPDSRKEYIQLVEYLSDVLIQEFDPKTTEKLDAINKKIKTNLENFTKKDKPITKDVYILNKLDLMRELLRMMMIRLKELGYFKMQVYSEGGEDDDE